MKKRRKLVTAIMAVCLTVTTVLGIGMTAKADTCGGLEKEDIYTPSPNEVIKDPVLHWAIRASMNAIKSGVKLTADMVGDKSVRNISYELCAHPEDFEGWEVPYWIENLEGIQYAKSATMVDICYTAAIEGKSIQDLSPLSALTQLDSLLLKQDGITDMDPLKKLVNLTQLDMAMNSIQDAGALKDMKKLTHLNLSANKIQDVDAIEGLEKLQYVDISRNEISSLPKLDKLTEVKTFLASNNQLTDVSELAKLKNLEVLDLASNEGLEDVRALARLTKLKKENTILPNETMKTDLFAAIGVNQLFEKFNISKMTEADLENVQNALAAYEALTDEQKTYMDEARIEAARSNMELVQAGKPPVNYPEYDEGGEPVPVWDRLEIKVVDVKGKPMPDVEFTKSKSNFAADEPADETKTTDASGRLVLSHSTTDGYFDEIAVFPAGDKYIAEPEEITYTVSGKTTETVNGKAATGLENLKFVLIPAYKGELKETLAEAEKTEEEYKYTEESFREYTDAFEKAKSVYEDAEATEEEVKAAADKLEKAIKGLTKSEHLSKLKVIVKDVNQNLFTRAFKFQYTSAGGSYNVESDPQTGVMYLEASPGWEDGMTWTLKPCYEELYSMDPVTFTIGKAGEKTYFKTVDGAAVDADFEKEVTVIYTGTVTPGWDPRLPDKTVLEGIMEEAQAVTGEDYTPSSYQKLQEALEEAGRISNDPNAGQEDYNQAAADLRAAKDGLLKLADLSQLKKEMGVYESYSYSKDQYTEESFQKYADAYVQAKALSGNKDASQEEVDAAVKAMEDAKKGLQRKVDKTELQKKIEEIEALNADDYESGFEELMKALEEARAVLNDPQATQDEVDGQITKLDAALGALVEKPEEKDYACYPGVFRARVLDGSGQPVAGVRFEAVIGDTVDTEMPMVSDLDGMIQYYVSGSINGGKTTYIRLADEAWETADEHYFTVTGTSWISTMDTIDGKPYADGTCLTYTLVKKGTEPEPGDQILSDEKTFRAKVVDSEGNPVDGVSFAVTPDDPYADTYSAESEDGILEHEITNWDYQLTFTVSLEEGQTTEDGASFKTDDVHTFKTDGTTIKAPKIVEVDGASIEETGEVVFTLTKDGGTTPDPGPGEVDKTALQDALDYAKAMKSEDYTPESYAKLQEAIQEAEEVYNDKQASEAAVAEQVEKLNQAVAGLKPADKTVYTDKNTIRISIQDEKGELATDSLAFQARTDVSSFPLYSSKGILEYQLSGADSGVGHITISLKDETVEIDGVKYTLTPKEHIFTIQSDSLGVAVTEVDGEPLEGEKEVVFTLTKDGGTTPDPEPVDKTGLEEELAKAKAIEQGNYTLNSYKALQTAVKEAEKIVEKEDATQEEVDAAKAALEEAVSALREVTGMRTLTIPVESADGSPLADNIKFIRDNISYNVQLDMYANDGKIQWKLGGYEDEGYYDFYLPENSAYIATPSTLTVYVEKEDGTAVIKEIEGEPAQTASAKFRLTAKSTDACDMVTFRAQVQDEEGSLLKDVKFDVENGDPEELISDENGMLTYHVTSWDIGEVITLSVQEGQKWVSDQKISFQVGEDPEQPYRGVITEINGQPFQGGEKPVFRMTDKDKPQEVDKTELGKVIQEAQLLDKDQYTEESYAAIEKALEEALAVFRDGNAAQEDVNAKAQALRNAIDAKVEKPDPEPTPDPEPDPDPTPEPDPAPTPNPAPGTGNPSADVKNPSGNGEKKAAKTADTQNPLPYAAGAAASIAMLAVWGLGKKRKHV